MIDESKFRITAYRLKAKVKFNNFVFNDIEESVGFSKLEKFMKDFYVVVSPSFEDYMTDNKPKKRQIKALIIKLIDILIAFRFMISIIFNNKTILSLMSDANYLLGNQRLVSSVLAFGSVVINLSIGGLIQYMEMKSIFNVIPFLYGIKKKTNDNQLKSNYKKKFAIHLKFITKYTLNPALYFIWFNAFVILCVPTIIAYFNPEMNFSLISITIWNFFTIIWLMECYAIVLGGNAFWYLSTLHLKYQFKQINDQIEESLVNGNIFTLMNAIRTHNLVTKSTEKLNSMFKYIIFIIYYFAKPPCNIMLYITYAPDSQIFARFLAGLVGLTCISVIFTVNLMSAAASKAAHYSCPLLYTFIVRRDVSVRNKLKIMAFIEKLSGPNIGFYCWDLFPMNNFEFYQYIGSWVTNYFLIMNLI